MCYLSRHHTIVEVSAGAPVEAARGIVGHLSSEHQNCDG